MLAVGVTGQGDGTWLVDDDGRPVRPAILWSDGRTAALVQEAYRSGLSAEIFQITGTALNTCNQGFHLRWLQENEPATLARTAAVLRAKDWIFLKLTGVVSTDETDASHTFFSIHARRYDERIFALLGIEPWRSKIPPAPPPAQHLAPLLPAVAAELGLRPGTPITAGPVRRRRFGPGCRRHRRRRCLLRSGHRRHQPGHRRPPGHGARQPGLQYLLCAAGKLPAAAAHHDQHAQSSVVCARVLRRRTPGRRGERDQCLG